MISAAKIKHIKGLSRKKNRVAHQQFVVEGVKGVEEVRASGFEVDAIYTTVQQDRWASTKVSEKDMARMTSFSSPSPALAVVNIPSITPNKKLGKQTVFIDGISDPGNLGTIIRIADWFGFEDVICSPSTVDVYNPKTVQASMGSLFRTVPVVMDLSLGIADYASVYGEGAICVAVMDGEQLTAEVAQSFSAVVIGNEAHGVSDDVRIKVQNGVTIPRKGKAESLNAGVAFGIIAAMMKLD